MNALGIDVGTSNVKTVLIDDHGSLLAAATFPLTTVNYHGTATQDPDAVWDAVRTTISEISTEAPEEAKAISDIAVCSQYSSVVAVDSAGKAISPVIMYMDRRGTDHCLEILERHPDAFETFVERHGIPPIGAGLTLSHLLTLERDDPDLAQKTDSYLEVMDFVNLRLTGRAVATQATMFASQLCDNRRVGQSCYDTDLLSMAGIDPARLPELVELGSIVAEVDARVAEALRIPRGARIHAAMNDTHAAAFATGVMKDATTDPDRTGWPQGRPHSVGMVVGTTGVIVDSAPGHKVDLDHEVLTMPSPVAGRHIVMAENGLAGGSVQRFFDLIGLEPFEESNFEQLLELSPPGAAGVIFMPWMDGSMSPSADPSVRGGLIGLSLNTTRHDLLRAAVEGTAFNLAWLLPAVENLTGNKADRLTFAGGAARSSGWAQTLSNVTQLPVDVVRNPHLAAAMAVARVALANSSGADPTDVEARIDYSHEPDTSLAPRYELMREQFIAAFSQSRGICEALGHG